MNLHELRPAKGSTKKRKRVGRGVGAGHGRTSGRGHKGQKARSGGGKGPGFEGGQQPLQRRLPKLPGFKNPFKKQFNIINVSSLERFEAKSVVDAAALEAKGMLSKKGLPVKILGDGDLTKELTVKADAVSGSARAKIEKAGGKVETG
ncbi:MAG: 50S ribosomal protein L15 [Actinobacteria bacterium]|nr:MAG: 50S ribosomal protein L15 [Actinomycetota bacterium]